MALLDRVDYGDAFAATCAPEVVECFTPEELGEMAMGRAPRWLRTVVRVTQHRLLGLQLDRSRLHLSFGWPLLDNTAHQAIYGMPGRVITPRLLVLPEPHRVLVVFLMRQEQPWATPIVAVVKPIHRAIVRFLLDRCVRLATDEAIGRTDHHYG